MKVVQLNETMEVGSVKTELSVKSVTKTFDLGETNNSTNNKNNDNNNNEFKYILNTPSLDDSTCHERFQSLPIRSEHERFLRECIEIILNVAIFDDTQREKKVLEWHQPDELTKLFDMKLKAQSDSDEKLLVLLKNTIQYSVKTGHPYFVNQLFSSVDPYALAGQWLTDALNPSVYTYEVSPVFIMMEEIVLREMRSIIGWTNGNGDGLFSPGGSISNAYAISCARYKFMPDLKVHFEA